MENASLMKNTYCEFDCSIIAVVGPRTSLNLRLPNPVASRPAHPANLPEKEHEGREEAY